MLPAGLTPTRAGFAAAASSGELCRPAPAVTGASMPPLE
jgi:hypothetical protein